MDDYSGSFDPNFSIARLSRSALARLAREYMLAAHLQDRVGMPQLLGRFGVEVMRRVAIEEWMGASPIYTRRMQRALNFEGSDVATIFKGIQLDVGAPHGYLDFRFTVHDANSGEFMLPYCGALTDTEPMGEDLVRGMCHDIEDPTFDATAVATNARAQVRPLHRPPRLPAGRVPVCHWTTRIDPSNEPVHEIPLTGRVRQSKLAQLELAKVPSAERGGLEDYSGSLDPEFQLEDLAHATLVRTAQEFCLQGHLLVRSFMLSVAESNGDDLATRIAEQIWVGCGALAAERVARELKIEGDGLDTIARLLQVHPCFHPREYLDLHVELASDGLRFWLGDCPALSEGDPYSQFAGLGATSHRALDAIVRTRNPRAACVPTAPPAGARLAWRVEIDPLAEPAPEPPELGLVRFSSGATFVFREPSPRERGDVRRID